MQFTKERKESRWLQDFGLVYHVTRWERLHGERFGERHFGDVSLRYLLNIRREKLGDLAT